MCIRDRYAQRKKWPVESVRVELDHSRVHIKDCAEAEQGNGRLDYIRKRVTVRGPLTEEQIKVLKNTSARSAEGSAQASDGGSAGAAAASTVATGEMSEAEIAEARARELKESQQ